MNILRNAILIIGLYGILGLLYFNVHVRNVITVNPIFRPDIHIYHKPNNMDSVDVKDELPYVKFGGMKVKSMYFFKFFGVNVLMSIVCTFSPIYIPTILIF